MFAISQFVLKSLKVCSSSSLPSYSIALGILLYASLYVYLLYYQNDYIYIFNKFVIYIIGIDLLLSAFLYFKQDTTSSAQLNSALSHSFEDNPNITLFDDNQELDQDSDYSQSDCENETDSVEELDLDENENQDMSGLQQQLDQLLGTEQSITEDQQQQNTLELQEPQQNTLEPQDPPSQTSTTEAKERANIVEADGDTEIELTDLQSHSEPIKRKRGRPPKGQSVQLA